MHEAFLGQAIAEASSGAQARDGGPFGAVVVMGDEVIARAHNRVLVDADPTAHAEVVAIRAACAARGHHSLVGATLYASCEPCPMCFCAIAWARISRVYYAATRDDAATVGFDDAHFHAEIARPPGERELPMRHVAHPDSQAPFRVFSALPDRNIY